MSDPAVAYQRHADAEEDAAERTHVQKMSKLKARLDDLELRRRDKLAKYAKEEADIRNDICKALGVDVGDMLKRKDLRFDVVSVHGEFVDMPSGVLACVRCECAPETKDGFHKTRRTMLLEFDETAISQEDIDYGRYLLAEE